MTVTTELLTIDFLEEELFKSSLKSYLRLSLGCYSASKIVF